MAQLCSAKSLGPSVDGAKKNHEKSRYYASHKERAKKPSATDKNMVRGWPDFFCICNFCMDAQVKISKQTKVARLSKSFTEALFPQ